MLATALIGMGSLGAAMHVAGSVLIVFGQASVKVAHSIVDSTGAPSTWAVPRSQPHAPLWRRPDGKWRRQKAGSKAYAFGGWSAFALGNLMRFVAMRFAAQTVLSGLGSLQFVIIPIASRFMLGIRASASTVLGVAVVLVGNALIILYGPAEVTFTLEQLRGQWATPAMTTFLGVLGSLLCLLQWLHWRLGSSGVGAQPQPQVVATLEGGKTVAELGGAAAPESQRLLGAGSGKWVHVPSLGLLQREQDAASVFAGALLFSAVASFVGAWSVLFSKSLTYVVSYLPGSLSDWYSWFILMAFLATAAFWVRQSDRGLRCYPASLIMPLMQAFWMCMSVLEGGIYFDELAGLPSRGLALLVLGLLLALLGAIFMGVAGFVAEKPEQIFGYAAAASELAAVEGGTQPLSPPPPTVGVIVERWQSQAGRADRLSSPVYRAGGYKNAYFGGDTTSGGADGEPGKRWWQDGSTGGVTQVHAIATSPNLRIELPRLQGAPPGSPVASSPRALARLQAVRSPTQQLLSRENSGGLDLAQPPAGGSAFEQALCEAGAPAGRQAEFILRDSLGGGSAGSKGTLQRR